MFHRSDDLSDQPAQPVEVLHRERASPGLSGLDFPAHSDNNWRERGLHSPAIPGSSAVVHEPEQDHGHCNGNLHLACSLIHVLHR